MLVRRFYDDRLAQASFLIGCQQTGDAIVIDPARDIAPYLEAARNEGVRIAHVSETHIHADFVSGTRELAHATGATVHLSGAGGADWQYRYPASDQVSLLQPDDVITLGRVTLRVLHTPGHTPEHIAFVVTDRARSLEPVAIVSGDFLFVGDVGRPDLLEVAAGVAGTKEASARSLFHSLQQLAALPDHLQVWPGHGAGSACGKALGSLPSSTLGYERLTGWAFQASDEAAFVAAVLEGQPTPPPYFAHMKHVNRDGAELLGNAAPAMLAFADLAAARRDGTLLDIRPIAAYQQQHLRGTISIPLRQSLTKWAGWLIPYDRPLYLIADDAAAAVQAQRALAAIGLDRVAGVFGVDALRDAAVAGETESGRRVTILDAARLQHGGTVIIDVREDDEWSHGHISAAVHHPLGTLMTTMAGFDRATPVAVHCQGGTRSAIAASVLDAMGFGDVTDLSGGWKEWQRKVSPA